MQVVFTTCTDFLREPLDFLDSAKHSKPFFPKKAQLPQRTMHSLARKCCHFLAYTYFHANFISIDMIFKVHPKFKYYAFERGFITKFTFREHHQFNVTSLGDITIHPFIMEKLKSLWWCNLVIMSYPNFDGHMPMVILFMLTYKDNTNWCCTNFSTFECSPISLISMACFVSSHASKHTCLHSL